jgi:hypothetical protein
MNENNSFDYTVTKKIEGKYLLYRTLMVMGYVFFGFTYFFGLFYAHLYPLMAFVVLLEWILVFLTWRYVSIEYKYETESGIIHFYNVYGGKSQKQIIEVKIKDFKDIGILDDEAFDLLSKENFDAVYSFIRSESDSADKYYATFEKDGARCVVYFIAPEQMLKILKFFNSAAR